MNVRPFWWDTVPAADPLPAAALPSRVDVLIVGGGYTGLAAGRHLARVGASVAVVERERIGAGASSRNGGQVLAGLKLDPGSLLARFGEPRARRLFDASLDAVAGLERLIAEEGIACGYVRTGHIEAAARPSHFRALRAEQALLARVFRHQVDLVPRGEQRTELGTDVYHGLLVDGRSGALNPGQYVHGLARAAARAGTILVEGVGVERLVRSEARWRVETPVGHVDAGDVLVATSGYTDSAVPWLQRRFVPIGSYIVVTEPLAASDAAALVPRRRMAFDSKHFLHYFRLTDDDRLLFGGRATFSRPSAATTLRSAAVLRKAMIGVFPQLRAARVDYAWSGTVAFTRDQMPRAGRIDGAYYAGGYCGHGVAMATALGTEIARRIAGELNEHPLFDDKFPPIPLYRGDPWFLPLVGAYYRLQDFLM